MFVCDDLSLPLYFTLKSILGDAQTLLLQRLILIFVS